MRHKTMQPNRQILFDEFNGLFLLVKLFQLLIFMKVVNASTR